MSRYIIDNRITEPEDMKGFDRDGYAYLDALSTEDDWYFARS